MSLLPDDLERFVLATAPEPDETLIEMDEYAVTEGFPHVGAEVGTTLRLLARMVDAERVFEFGSGFGYSAYWLAEALPADGEIVLTEVDADELELAREHMAKGGYDGVARYEQGDALETIERYDGPFDVVLIDHQKTRYREAFEAIEDAVAPGGIIVADNAMTAGIVDFDALLEIVEGGTVDDVDEHTGGVADYLETVTTHPDYETVALPLGEGIAVSYRLD